MGGKTSGTLVSSRSLSYKRIYSDFKLPLELVPYSSNETRGEGDERREGGGRRVPPRVMVHLSIEPVKVSRRCSQSESIFPILGIEWSCMIRLELEWARWNITGWLARRVSLSCGGRRPATCGHNSTARTIGPPTVACNLACTRQPDISARNRVVFLDSIRDATYHFRWTIVCTSIYMYIYIYLWLGRGNERAGFSFVGRLLIYINWFPRPIPVA